MSLVETLLRRTRSRQIEKAKEGWEAYRELRLHAAQDEHAVDVDRVESICFELGVSLDQFAKDVETTRNRRLPAVERLKTESKVRQERDAAQAKLEQLQAELERVSQALKAQITEAFNETQRLNTEVELCDTARHVLRSTVIEKSITEREADIRESMNKLSEERNRLEAAVVQTQRLIASAEKNIDWYKDAVRGTGIEARLKAEYAERRESYERGIVKNRDELAKHQEAVRGLESQRRELQRQLEQVELEKLLP